MDQNLDLKQLMKLAQSPAGQQLLQLLQQRGGRELEAAAQRPPQVTLPRPYRHCPVC